MKAKSKQKQWFWAGVMILAIMLIPMFSQSPVEKEVSPPSKPKMYYLKSGDNQYFYINNADKVLGCFLISPTRDITIKKAGQDQPISGLDELDKSIVIEVKYKEDNKSHIRVLTILKKDENFNINIKNDDNAVPTQEEDSVGKALSFLSGQIEEIMNKDKNLSIKYHLSFPPIEQSIKNKLPTTADINALLSTFEVNKSATVSYLENGIEETPPQDMALIKNIIEEKKTFLSFKEWQSHLQNVEIADLGDCKAPAGIFKASLEGEEPQTSSLLIRFLEVGLPLLAVLVGLLLLYQFLVANYLNDLKDIRAQVKRPKTIRQTITAIEEYLKYNACKKTKKSLVMKILAKIKKQAKNSGVDEKTPDEKELEIIAGALTKYIELESNVDSTTVEEIKKLVQEILISRKKIQHGEPNYILGFIDDDFQFIVNDYESRYEVIRRFNRSTKKSAAIEAEIKNKIDFQIDEFKKQINDQTVDIKDNFVTKTQELEEKIKTQVTEFVSISETQTQSFKNEISSQNKELDRKIEFIKQRTSNPASIADTVILINGWTDEIDQDTDQQYNEITIDDGKSTKSKEDWKRSKKAIVTSFQNDILAIAKNGDEFEEKAKKLRDRFDTFSTVYIELIENSLIKSNSPDYPDRVHSRLNFINEKIVTLQDDYREYSKINNELKALAETLKNNEGVLSSNIIKAQKVVDNLGKKLEGQNTKGDEFLKTFGTHLQSLGTERNNINRVASELKAQNLIVLENSKNINAYTGELSQQVANALNAVAELQKKVESIQKVSGELKSNKDLLKSEVTNVSNVILKLEEQRLTGVSLAQSINEKVETLEACTVRVTDVTSGLKIQSDNCNSVNDILIGNATNLAEGFEKLNGVVGLLKDAGIFETNVVEDLKKQVDALKFHINKVTNLIIDISGRNEAGRILSDDLQTKAVSLFDSVSSFNDIKRDLVLQNEKGEDILQSLSKDLIELRTHLEKASTVAIALDGHNAKGAKTAKGFEEFAQDLNTQMAEMQKVVKDIQHLQEEVVKVEKTAEDLADFNKSLVATATSNNPDLELCREVMNDELLLNLTSQNTGKVLKKLKGEPALSKEYRYCGINLYKDLTLLEKKLKDKWFWRLIKPIKDGLDFNIRAFYRWDGKTIYDTYLANGNASFELSSITEENIKTVINEMHWTQIWEHLIKANGFFNAYLEEELKPVTDVLGGAQQKIVTLMENYLGYQVEPHKPLQLISKRLIESGDVKEVSEHFVFYREILPEIKTSKRLLGAEAVHREDSENNLILFVDALGLKDNGKSIRKPQMVFYSSASMKHYR